MPDAPNTPAGRLPDFVAVGPAKTGTSSLHRYLCEHPQIHMARPKGPRFFCASAESNFHRGLDWYRSLFCSDRLLCGEVTPSYTRSTAPVVAQRMQAIIPHARLVYNLREPWSRMISHYRMLLRLPQKQCHRFEEDLPRYPNLRESSLGGTQLSLLRAHFPAGQIHCLESQRLLTATRPTLKALFEFLGADSGFDSPLFGKQFNVGDDKEGRTSPPQQSGSASLPAGAQSPAPRTESDHKSEPHILIPPTLVRQLHDEFCREVDLLRQLTSQPLASLEVPSLADLLAAHT
jgi:hypothetical protein